MKGGYYMARKVKCQITGEYGTSDTFYKASNGHYYKSKEIYEQDKKDKKYYSLIKDTICFEFLGYQKGQKFPTTLTKKLKELSFYPNEVIYKTIQDQKENIEYWILRKDFSSDYGKIAYIFAIITNNINDVYRNWKINQHQQIKQEQWQDEPIEIIKSKQHKSIDISKWLDGDD